MASTQEPLRVGHRLGRERNSWKKGLRALTCKVLRQRDGDEAWRKETVFVVGGGGRGCRSIV